MATFPFTIPDNIVIELNHIATQHAHFPNAKEMVIAYLTATVKAHREKELHDAVPPVSISDVTII